MRFTAGGGTGASTISGLLGPAVVSPCNFPGADASLQIQAAAAALPAAGGTIDGRCLTGNQTFSVDPFNGITKPTTIILAAATFTSGINLNVPSNVTLTLERGSLFSMATGTTMTIRGGFADTSVSQHFLTGATHGSVVMGAPSTAVVFPQWWGALGDNTNDDTAGIQGAIAAVVAKQGGTVWIPNGTYRVLSSLNLTGLNLGGVHILGDSMYNTAISAQFSGGPVFDLSGSTLLRLDNFSIRAISGFTPTELILLARPSNNNSAGNHLLERLWLQGTCTHALISCIGSEQNLFSDLFCQTDNDGPCFTGAMWSAAQPNTPPGGAGTAAGWQPVSPFITIGTGEGGNTANVFLACTFQTAQTAVMTRSLVYFWGMSSTALYGCFFAGPAPSTVDMRAIQYPSGGGNYYKTNVTFDTCSDENPGTVIAGKNTLLFSAPTVTVEPSIRGCHVRNCFFFNIFGQDNVWVDDLELIGGHASNSTPTPTGTKVSVWRLDNSILQPSQHERGLGYTVRNQGSGISFVGILSPGLSLTGVASYTISDTYTGTYQATGLLARSANGIGYMPNIGVGGTVTQLTSKITGVTLNAICGQITMNNASLAAGAAVHFVFTNSTIAATDVVLVSIAGGGTTAAYTVGTDTIAAGSCGITLHNFSAAALAEAVVLSFAVIKGTTN